MRLSADVIRTTASVVTILSVLAGIIIHIVHLEGRVGQLEEQVHSLASTLAEISKKPVTAVNPMQQKCAELAEQAASGSHVSGIVGEYGKDFARDAIMLMDKLGCGSTVR